jgi:uncharacterized membrane protein
MGGATMVQSEKPASAEASDNAGAVLAVYVLYLSSLFFVFPSLVGIVIAYVFRNDGPQWARSHYQFLIRTFWISWVYGIPVLILMLVLIGYPLAILYIIWFIVRCIIGLRYWSRKEPHPNPTSWLFG